jgi:AcrR family transcriptional regulator
MTTPLGAEPETDPAREAVRLALLTAAERCFGQFGIAKTTMEDIARSAGVSRATVYRYFADREALVLASVIRRARSDIPRARRHLERFGAFGDKIVEGLVRNVERGRRDPVVQLLVNSDQPALAARVLGGEGVSHQLSYELWEPVLAAAQDSGQMNPALDRRMACAWLARVTLIMVAQEKSTQLSPDELRAEFRTFVVPAFLPPALA